MWKKTTTVPSLRAGQGFSEIYRFPRIYPDSQIFSEKSGIRRLFSEKSFSDSPDVPGRFFLIIGIPCKNMMGVPLKSSQNTSCPPRTFSSPLPKSQSEGTFGSKKPSSFWGMVAGFQEFLVWINFRISENLEIWISGQL